MRRDLVICPGCGERFELEDARSLVVTCHGCGKVFNAAAFVAPGSWEHMRRSPDAPVPSEVPGAGETAVQGQGGFAHYELVSELGRNDLGVVYRARDSKTGEIFALKALAADSQAARKSLPGIVERVRAAASLSHDNIARIIEVGEFEGTPYVASEFVEGKSLRRFMSESRFSVSEAVCLAATAARALAYAHGEGHVHGDIRPENIIIDSFGNPRLTDFGLARSIVYAKDLGVSDVSTAERHGYALPVYIPPEQANGLPLTVASDVYSMGAVLYEMLAGRPPVEADHLLRLLIKINRDEPRPLKQANPRVPSGLAAIVSKCMAKDPADRYAGGGELSRELEAFMGGRMISAQKAGLAALAGRWFTRRIGALAALIVAAAAVMLAGLKVADWVQSRPEGARAEGLESARARYERGMAEYGAKNYADAAEDLAAAVVGGLADEDGLRAGYALAVSLNELGRQVAAERAFGDLVSRYPGRPEGWHGRGYVRYSLKSYEAARTDFTKAVRLEPENAGYRYCLGMAAWGSGDRKAAEAEISRALELSPGNDKWRAHLDALRAEMRTPHH